MKKTRLFLGCVAIGGIGIFGYAKHDPEPKEELTRDFSTWAPSVSEVHDQLKALPGTGSQNETERLKLFSRLYTRRFHKHDPAFAIALRFLNNKTIKLMCPARMELWNVDRLAVAAWQETRNDFGRDFNIDIYTTYVGYSIKTGEMRPVSKDSPRLRILYNIQGMEPSPSAETVPSQTSRTMQMQTVSHAIPAREENHVATKPAL